MSDARLVLGVRAAELADLCVLALKTMSRSCWPFARNSSRIADCEIFDTERQS